MKIFLIVLLFLFVSALTIISNENLHLKEKNEAKEFANLYYSWIINTGSNFMKATGYVVKFEWLPNGNNTVSNSLK